MFEANAQGFASFFRELWGYPPFAWQQALAERVLGGGHWPDAIALPTAAGKTACLDIAVFALAAQADRLERGELLTTPRRVFFAVDRRMIVDEAFERARELARRLLDAEGGILKEVADRLRRVSGGSIPLACHQLRGGMFRSDAWARDPAQPAIVATTVDQLGSRLLFRAYGRSFKAWPIQAGLVGNDSLILLDEAHCAQPFMETLRAVARYRHWAELPLPSPFHLTVMSATPPDGLEVFEDASEEPHTPGHPLGDRQLAAKPATLIVADKAKGARGGEALAKVLAEQAEMLAGEDPESGRAPALVVFCNRVDTARKVWDRLVQRHGDRVTLLTGRMRPIDKDDTVQDRLDALSAGKSTERRLKQPLFVVATQTLEVGANPDFDRLVTEAAPLDALRQRFGRLNRMGRPVAARAVVVVRGDQAQNSEDDPVYGQALAATWGQLSAWGGEQQTVDFGIAALNERLQDLSTEEWTKLNAPSGHAPVLLPAHLDAWVQTAPEPWPTPDVALFLHGPRSGPADVQVCWRADLTGDDAKGWEAAVAICPPSSPETLTVPIGQLRRWLTGEDAPGGADVEGGDPDAEAPPNTERAKGIARRVVRWRGADDVETVADPAKIRPGDVVIVPKHLGGFEELATLGSPNPVADWGDRAFAATRDKAILRLHPEVMAQWAATEALRPFSRLTQEEFDADPQTHQDDLQGILAAIATAEGTPKWLRQAADHFSAMRQLDRLLVLHPTQGWVLLGRAPLGQYAVACSDFGDEDDPTASGTVRRGLEVHLTGVGEYAARFAQRCGLPTIMVETVEQAGRRHDLGKADPRFQAWLKGGASWGDATLLAKSDRMSRSLRESEASRERAGYPKGGRHELLSVRLLESRPERLPADAAQRDLLLHLVASHHGYCRPFAPVVRDGHPQTVEYDGFEASSATEMERLDSGVAERFWRLTRLYGWWGLAWLEAITRLADHRRSEAEERNQGGKA